MKMKNTARYLKNLIKTGEGYHLEFKKSLDKSFPEEICAFVNASGGKVLVGVADDGTITGTATDNVSCSRIQDVVNQIEPQIDAHISVVGKIIVVDVPEGREKPYGCSRGFFLRIGPNTQKLTRNQIVSFFQKEGLVRFDEMENRKAVFNRDFDESAFKHFIGLASITPSIEKKFLLANLDCLSQNGQMTNAGVLFFSKSTEFLLLQATVTCVLYKGTEKVHVLDRKDFSDNLLSNIENAVMFVMRHTNLEYKIEKLRREEIPEIPEVALREAVVNAVCHRDYFEKGAHVMIEIFSRIRVSQDFPPKAFDKKLEETTQEINGTTQETTQEIKETTQETILALIKINPAITRKELAEKIGITPNGIKYHLDKLRKQGVIRHVGATKKGCWELVEDDD